MGPTNMTLEQCVASERTRATWVGILLVIAMVLDSAAILSGVAQQRLLSRAASGVEITEAEATSNDLRHGAIGVFQTLVFLTTAICWLVWLHRAYSNVRLMGTGKSDYTPGWAVGYWFVPIFNLFRPYQITKELWLRSARQNTMDSVKGLAPPTILTLWWGAYLISGLLGRVLFSSMLRADELEEIQRVTTMGMGIDALGILSAVLALAVVRRIDLLQQATISNAARPIPSDATA